MRNYQVPMVPGPTSVHADVLSAYEHDYASGDLEEEYFDLYGRVEQQLRRILRTENRVAVMTGEAMVGLWGAMKSCLRPGERVLAVATGLYGYGFAEMAAGLGAEVEIVGFEYDAVADPSRVDDAIRRFRPKMVTLVHCETPSGTLNPAAEIGESLRRHGVQLFYVDAVSSAAGAELRTDEWGIDLCLAGTQKALSAPPGLAIVSISERAWEAAAEVGYQGYDALLPWRDALEKRYFPYTPYWHGVAALERACGRILDEGLETVIARHARVAARCREGLREIGLDIYPAREEDSAPTVTAVKVPESIGWAELNRRLRDRGVGVGGNYGKLAGRVFRLGHMGTQANAALVDEAVEALRDAIG